MKYLPLIIGMSIVTYVPRLLPLILLNKRRINPKFQQFLQFIPYTSLSILILRGILTSPSEIIVPSIIGISLAGLISYYKNNLVLSVMTCIVVSFLLIKMI